MTSLDEEWMLFTGQSPHVLSDSLPVAAELCKDIDAADNFFWSSCCDEVSHSQLQIDRVCSPYRERPHATDPFTDPFEW